MAITSKEIDLFAWRNNNISIFAVSQENDGKKVTFNLYENDINHKLLNTQSLDYDAYLYVSTGNSMSACVTGTLDKSKSQVSFNISSCLVPKEGKFPCFIMLVYGDTVIKFGGMYFLVIDGNIKGYVDIVSKNDAFTECLATVAALKQLVQSIIGGDINLNNIMQFITETVSISATKEYKLTANDIAPSSPVYVSIKARTSTDDTLVRSDGEDLVDLLTNKIVDNIMTDIQITADDIIAGIKSTDGMSIQVKYYNANCEDLLQMIKNRGSSYTSTSYQQRYNVVSLPTVTETTYTLEGE